MLTSHARRLMQVLAEQGATRTDALDMAPADVLTAIDELDGLYDDEGRPVGVLKSWHAGGEVVALELTAQGKSLARALATAG